MSRPPAGVLPIDKPPGMTSHDVVALVRRAFRQAGLGKIKTGHAGTLDPGATGVLLVCVGSATRLADLLADQGKSYRCEFTLGAETSTEDSFGDVLYETDASRIEIGDVADALTRLTGSILQTPPMVSAVHHQGKRLYELARRGIVVEREPRPIEIKSIELLSFHSGASKPTGEMVVECGKGTYIRTLCADLGASLGVGGYMSRLRRLSVGRFTLADCITIDKETCAEVLIEKLVSPSNSVPFLPLRILTDNEHADILHGRAIPADTMDNPASDESHIRLVDSGGELVALASFDPVQNVLQPKKVLAAELG